MFYEATVINVVRGADNRTTLRLCFEGDSEVYEVDRTKAIRFEHAEEARRAARRRPLPEGADTTPAKRPRRAHNGSPSGSTVPSVAVPAVPVPVEVESDSGPDYGPEGGRSYPYYYGIQERSV